jgi:hypothetical protein
MWDALDSRDLAPSAKTAYERAIAFYDPWHASERLSLPRLGDHLVEIPVSLPDDEILVDRLSGKGSSSIEQTWQDILSQTYQRGEIFTLQLHPERIAICVDALSLLLDKARTLLPAVWIARMDEIAAWWHARGATTVGIEETGDGAWHISVAGPPGTTMLIRDAEVAEATEPWAGDYRRVFPAPLNDAQRMTCTVRAICRPFVGVAPTCPSELIRFLEQQGYILQVSRNSRSYPVYLDLPRFTPEHERAVTTQIEESTGPLVRLGCWPHGSRSALCITGDIDALTLWDYGLRLLGR